jgi:hypothetical protein
MNSVMKALSTNKKVKMKLLKLPPTRMAKAIMPPF